MTAPPPLVALLAAPSASPALRAAAVAWVGSLTPGRVVVLCDRSTVLAAEVAMACEARGIGVAWWMGSGPTTGQRGIVGVAAFGVRAGDVGVRVREWDAAGGAVTPPAAVESNSSGRS